MGSAYHAKSRHLEIDRLRKKLKASGSLYRVALPSLAVDNGARVGVMQSSLADCAGGCGSRKARIVGAHQFAVGTTHKQGAMLITEGAIKNGELQFFGGKKT